MLKVIFNQDGSIKSLEFPHYVTQGSSGELESLKLVAGVDELDLTDYTVVAVCKLPNGHTSSIALGETDTDGNRYGYLTEAQTYYAGTLYISIQISDNEDNVLYTYQMPVTVNPTTYDSGELSDNITNAQYTYLYKLVSVAIIDVENTYTKSETDTLLNGKVDKSSNQAVVYGTDVHGEQKVYDIDVGNALGEIVARDGNGQINVPQTPTDNLHATSKKYMDDALSGKQPILTAGTGITITAENVISATTIISLEHYTAFNLLPATGSTNVIYMVDATSVETNNLYDEYIWDSVNSRYEMIGKVSTTADLSGYQPIYAYDATKWSTTPTANDNRPMRSRDIRDAILNSYINQICFGFQYQSNYDYEIENLHITLLADYNTYHADDQTLEELLSVRPHTATITGYIEVYDGNEYIPCQVIDIYMKNSKITISYIRNATVHELSVSDLPNLSIGGTVYQIQR